MPCLHTSRPCLLPHLRTWYGWKWKPRAEAMLGANSRRCGHTRTSEWPRCRCLPVFCSNQGSSATGCLPRKVQRVLRTAASGMSPGIPRNRSPAVGSLQFTNPALGTAASYPQGACCPVFCVRPRMAASVFHVKHGWFVKQLFHVKRRDPQFPLVVEISCLRPHRHA